MNQNQSVCQKAPREQNFLRKNVQPAVRAKRKHDPVADRNGKGGNQLMFPILVKVKFSKEDVVNDSEFIKEVRERGSDKDSGGSISERKK